MSLNKFYSICYSYFCAALYAVLASTVFILPVWGCSTDCSISVNFTGVYNDETCNVVINNLSSNETVTLPQISISLLQKNGNETGSVPFEIALRDCPASRTITAFFNSSAQATDNVTGNLVNTAGANYSSNVQIRLRKEDGSQVIIDNNATGQNYIIPSSAEQVSHTFTASYYAKGEAAVTAGQVRAIAGVELVYR